MIIYEVTLFFNKYNQNIYIIVKQIIECGKHKTQQKNIGCEKHGKIHNI